MLERFNMVDYNRVGSPMAVDAFSNCGDVDIKVASRFGAVPKLALRFRKHTARHHHGC
jgi:hypothetical protein